MNRNHVLPLVSSCLLSISLFASPLSAQQGPNPMPGQGGPQQDHRGGQREDRGGMGDLSAERHGGMGIVPPGMWWKSPETVKALTLTPDQIKRLDDTLMQSRIQLIHMHASLEEEQLKLEPVLNTNPPDTGKALAEISKIADLRADLEKANAKMLLGLRSVLTADQWTKLQAMHHGGPRGGDHAGDRGGDRGPDSTRGRKGPGGPGGNLGNPPMPPSQD